MRYLKQLNEGLEKTHNIRKVDSKLDEALPKDLMKEIRRADSRGSYNRATNFNRSENIFDPQKIGWSGETRANVQDFANASAKEITAGQVKAMKKAGQDLSNVYIMTDYGMIQLDQDGHPYKSGSSGYIERKNQSLNKSLEDAKKIYLADIKDLYQTNPEKAMSRMGDVNIRKANLSLGHDRPRAYDSSRRNSEYVKKLQNRAGNSKEIAAIKAEYEAGDISRKEMEKRISDIQNSYLSTPDEYDVDDYNYIRKKNASDRYTASKQTLQKPFRDLEDARSAISSATYRLNTAKKNLADAQRGEAEGRYTSSEYVEAKREIENLKRQIEYAQKQLQRWQSKIDNGLQSAEVKKFEDEIASNQADINNAQAKIDRLLRRTESLKKKLNKKLNESLNKKSNSGTRRK